MVSGAVYLRLISAHVSLGGRQGRGSGLLDNPWGKGSKTIAGGWEDLGVRGTPHLQGYYYHSKLWHSSLGGKKDSGEKKNNPEGSWAGVHRGNGSQHLQNVGVTGGCVCDCGAGAGEDIKKLKCPSVPPL